MGIRTPQDLLRPAKQSASPRATFRGSSSKQISGQFLDTIQSGANAQVKAAAKRQKKKDDYVHALFKNDGDTIRVKHEAELADLEGQEALVGQGTIKQQFAVKMKERFDKLPENYKNDFRMRTAMAESMGKMERFSIGYVNSESRKLEDATFKARVANDMNDLVENSADVLYISGVGVDKVSDSIRLSAERTYGSDRNKMLEGGMTAGEMIDLEVQAGVSESLRKSIAQQVSVGRFDLAQSTVEHNIDRLSSEDRLKIQKNIETGRANQSNDIALSISEKAYASADGDLAISTRNAVAMAGGDGEIARKALTMIQTRHSIDKKAKKDKEDRAYDEGYDQLINTGTISPGVQSAMSPEKFTDLVNKANENRGRTAVLTDQTVFNEAKVLMNNSTDQDIAKMNLQKKYQHSINVDDIKILEKWQLTAQNRVNKNQTSGSKYSSSVSDRIAGIIGKEMKVKSKEDRGKLQRLTADLYGDLVLENPKISAGEMDRKLTRAVRDNIETETETHFFGADTVKDKLDLDKDSLRNVNKAGLAPLEIRRLQATRLSRGLPPYTEDQLIQFAQSRSQK